MSNRYYETYQKHYAELQQIMEKYKGHLGEAKKLKGAVAANLLKHEIEAYLMKNNKPIKVSSVNSYVAGSKYEYDLLLVKKDAIPFMELVYDPDKVIAIIESKVNGLFDVDAETNGIANAVNRAREINPNIRFGYITISENVPVHEYNKNGTSTVKHWELTEQYINEKIKGLNAIYAVTLRQGKKLCDEGSDKEFSMFLDNLIN